MADGLPAVAHSPSSPHTSSFLPGSHVHAHTGLTNARLRIHLGLSGLDNVWIKVADELRTWRDLE